MISWSRDTLLLSDLGNRITVTSVRLLNHTIRLFDRIFGAFFRRPGIGSGALGTRSRVLGTSAEALGTRSEALVTRSGALVTRSGDLVTRAGSSVTRAGALGTGSRTSGTSAGISGTGGGTLITCFQAPGKQRRGVGFVPMPGAARERNPVCGVHSERWREDLDPAMEEDFFSFPRFAWEREINPDEPTFPMSMLGFVPYPPTYALPHRLPPSAHRSPAGAWHPLPR
uniref:Uncharacterized protein n=1 Tax=Candidatus Kentrum sp. DK TaxID=2126562 RepID=A0A450TBT9_9GAMM|nr:MAG: hypothetical protein BECKDK2373C_GA0170839_11162 [Candidatus Kentron sp. DK]